MELTNDMNTDPVGYGSGMLVFVPEMLEDISDFARQIYTMAIDQQRWVMYLTLDGKEHNQLADARQLATLTALTQGNSVKASAFQAQVDDWTEALRQLTHPGDLVIWPEKRWFAPVSVEKALGITQQVLPGHYISVPDQAVPWYRTLLFWLIGLITIVGFSYLEITLSKMINGALMSVALIILVVLEVGILYQWDRIFR